MIKNLVLLPALMTGLLTGLVACQAQTPAAPPVPAPPQAIAAGGDGTAALERLRREIGAAPCERDEQCRTLAVGHKACGGPAAYWPWSSVNTSLDRLQPLAQSVTEADQRRQAADGMLSNCAIVADPGALCVAARCVLSRRAGAAAR